MSVAPQFLWFRFLRISVFCFVFFLRFSPSKTKFGHGSAPNATVTTVPIKHWYKKVSIYILSYILEAKFGREPRGAIWFNFWFRVALFGSVRFDQRTNYFFTFFPPIVRYTRVPTTQNEILQPTFGNLTSHAAVQVE